MSFILDALRKSEAERQRQDGPTLLEMRPSRPQRRVPVWVIGLGVLLLVNLLVLLGFLLHVPVYSATTHVQAPANSAPVVLPAAAPPAARTAPAVSAPAVSAPAVSAPAPQLAPGSAPPTMQLQLPSANTPAASSHPAAPAPSKPARPQLEPSETPADLPDYSRVSSGMPALRLDLHSYSEQPQQRYALINMHKVREGDTLPEGPRVLQILQDGVVLSYQGTEFVLGRN